MSKEPYYHQELAAADTAAASSGVPANRLQPAGRGMAALVHGVTLVFLGPLVIVAIVVHLIARFDHRPFVRQAAHDARWFDLWILGLAAVCVFLLTRGLSNDWVNDLSMIGLTLVGLTFVVSHVLGIVQSLRGRRFRYPLPPRVRRRPS